MQNRKNAVMERSEVVCRIACVVYIGIVCVFIWYWVGCNFSLRGEIGVALGWLSIIVGVVALIVNVAISLFFGFFSHFAFQKRRWFPFLIIWVLTIHGGVVSLGVGILQGDSGKRAPDFSCLCFDLAK